MEQNKIISEIESRIIRNQLAYASLKLSRRAILGDDFILAFNIRTKAAFFIAHAIALFTNPYKPIQHTFLYDDAILHGMKSAQSAVYGERSAAMRTYYKKRNAGICVYSGCMNECGNTTMCEKHNALRVSNDKWQYGGAVRSKQTRKRKESLLQDYEEAMRLTCELISLPSDAANYSIELMRRAIYDNACSRRNGECFAIGSILYAIRKHAVPITNEKLSRAADMKSHTINKYYGSLLAAYPTKMPECDAHTWIRAFAKSIDLNDSLADYAVSIFEKRKVVGVRDSVNAAAAILVAAEEYGHDLKYSRASARFGVGRVSLRNCVLRMREIEHPKQSES